MGTVAGEICDHLVGVHIRGGARAGLEDVDRELVVVLALGDRGPGRGDPLGQLADRACPDRHLPRPQQP